jgi:3-deoxy-D-manno-octulosonate 8-phosphate phosphatase (KDO 8-P phosphatase)
MFAMSDPVPKSQLPNPKSIQLLVFDVDGVLTDGTLVYHGGGGESKNFHTRDGLGLRAAMQAGLDVAVITARSSDIVARRMQELGIRDVVQNCNDKAKEVLGLSRSLGVPLEQMGYLGDDLVDLGAMRRVGYPMAVGDAAEELRAMAAFVTRRRGGRGAAREAIEHVLKAQGKWDAIVQSFGG